MDPEARGNLDQAIAAIAAQTGAISQLLRRPEIAAGFDDWPS